MGHVGVVDHVTIVLWTAVPASMSHKWPQTQKDVNEFSVLNIDDDYGMEATAVLHPFGRGRFKELAECAVIPNVLLDELIKTHAERDSQSTTWKLGGAARSKFKEVAQPRAIGANTGRGRALKLRAERYAQPLRRPGQHTNKVNSQVVWRVIHSCGGSLARLIHKYNQKLKFCGQDLLVSLLRFVFNLVLPYYLDIGPPK